MTDSPLSGHRPRTGADGASATSDWRLPIIVGYLRRSRR